jgi:HprK-related kinase A
MESGINWLIGTEMYGYLLLHAAVVARGTDALILPAPSGSGKSTLAAGLMAAGWRLLSDEFVVIDPSTAMIRPCLKTISLKEQAIPLMRERLPRDLLPDVYYTVRGEIALLRPTQASIEAVDMPARARWVISPQFTPGAQLKLTRVPRSQAFVTMASNSFNYYVLGSWGFHALADTIITADTYELIHGDNDTAVGAINRLAQDR